MPRHYKTKSKVEEIALQHSPYDLLYPPTEKIKTLVVENFPTLGKVTALRFLEWVQKNPGGVIALPTGKTPEYFIKWTQYILNHWEEKRIQKLLEESGVDPAKKPDMGSLWFVQIDEFYPINPWQHNSFYFYVNQFYIEGFGLDPNKALLIDSSKIGIPEGETLESIWPDNRVDITLRYRKATTRLEAKQKAVLENIDEWCQEYEEKIRKMGGIGFFLGGIGPDGHIAFNIRGSDHHSTTRLMATNYETQAAAATDLGGIEIARERLVITIGLGTITYNPETTAIIIAAGETKASMVADAIQQERHVKYPGTALQVLPNARFYITQGAAKHLTERQLVTLKAQPQELPQFWKEKIVIDVAIKTEKRLTELTARDLKKDRFGAVLMERLKGNLQELLEQTRNHLIEKTELGALTLKGKRFLHTEPHHDDIMLAYLPYLVRHIREASNTHHFVTLTSGFTSVTNFFMKWQMENLLQFIEGDEFRRMLEEGYFDPENHIGRNRDVWQYLDGVAANSEDMKNEGIARRMLRNLIEVFEEYDLANLKNRVTELLHYFTTQYPGKKDPEYIQKLKGMVREWEAECLWGYFGWSCENVHHLRLGFYTGDIFTEEPTVERDVKPILKLLEKTRPDIVTVALDPEASGPDTHYKVLQAIAEALKLYEKQTGRSDIKVLGYRNIWYRFHPAEADIFVPVSLNMFSILQNSFMNSFLSQKEASFPSYEHDGPFSELAQRIQVEQYQAMKTTIGREWFNENPSPLIRATRGLVYLREMSLQEFYSFSRELRQILENR